MCHIAAPLRLERTRKSFMLRGHFSVSKRSGVGVPVVKLLGLSQVVFVCSSPRNNTLAACRREPVLSLCSAECTIALLYLCKMLSDILAVFTGSRSAGCSIVSLPCFRSRRMVLGSDCAQRISVVPSPCGDEDARMKLARPLLFLSRPAWLETLAWPHHCGRLSRLARTSVSLLLSVSSP